MNDGISLELECTREAITPAQLSYYNRRPKSQEVSAITRSTANAWTQWSSAEEDDDVPLKKRIAPAAKTSDSPQTASRKEGKKVSSSVGAINQANYVSEKVTVKNFKEKQEDDRPTSTARASKYMKMDDSKKSSVMKITSPVKGYGKAGASKEYAAKANPAKKEKEQKDDEHTGLESMYYGVQYGRDNFYEEFPLKPITKLKKSTAAIYDSQVECPICETATTFDSNEMLQTHLVSHINIDGKNLHFQCIFCLEKFNSKVVMAEHKRIMHPDETKSSNSASYRCLICQQDFDSLIFLTSHLQENHYILELPYCCQACGYRTSLHRDAISHYYDDHKQHNFLQCPFCLDIYRFAYKGHVNRSNIEHYYTHLRQHMDKKDPNLRCTKCYLSFIDKGSLKQHFYKHHTSLLKSSSTVRQLLRNSMFIEPPKVQRHRRKALPYSVQSKLGQYFAFINISICAECHTEVLNEKHFIENLKCKYCNYRSSCERAMFQHASDCNGPTGFNDILKMPLPNEMHCICGVSTANGNDMAYHLAKCDQEFIYLPLQMLQENTVMDVE